MLLWQVCHSKKIAYKEKACQVYRPGARIACQDWGGGGGGHKQILGKHKNSKASNLRVWTRKQRSLLRIFTNSGVKTKKRKKKTILKTARISTSWGETRKKRVFIAKSKKTVLAYEFWDDNQYFGSLRHRTALQCRRTYYFF